MAGQKIRGKTFERTLTVRGPLMVAKPFLLTSANFMVLTRVSTGAVQVSYFCVGSAIATAIPMFTALVDGQGWSAVSLLAIGILLAVGALAPVVGRFLPTERTRLTRDIKAHFAKHPEKPLGGA